MDDFSVDPRVLAALRTARRPAIFTHVYPDGDAIGSELGLDRAFRALGAEPMILNAHPSPLLQEFLDPEGVVDVVFGDLSPAQQSRLAAADLLVVVDTSEPSRLGYLEEAVLAHPARKVCIDHHLSDGGSPFDPAWIEPSCPATGLLIWNVIRELGVQPTPAIAEPLFVALATDTGWFRYGNADSGAFRTASELVASGADPSFLYSALFESSSLGRTHLLGSMLAGIHTEAQGRLIVAQVSRAELDRHGIEVEEVDGFVDSLKEVRGAQILALFVEVSTGKYKVSLRSKGDRGVHELAVGFGGGGHSKAAGYRVEGRLDEVVGAFVAAARQALDRP